MQDRSEDEDRTRGDEDDAVPGVRGPLGPAGSERDESGRAGTGPFVDQEPPDWGMEGGAGAYRGAPIISDTEDDVEDAIDRKRRAAGARRAR